VPPLTEEESKGFRITPEGKGMFEGDVKGLNVKVAPLVRALNDAGIETTMSGDMYGTGVVYVDIDRKSIGSLDPSRLPAGWKLTTRWLPGTNRDILGTPLSEGHTKQEHFIAEGASGFESERLARKDAGTITPSEIEKIVAAFETPRVPTDVYPETSVETGKTEEVSLKEPKPATEAEALTPAELLHRMPEALFVEEFLKPEPQRHYPFNDLLAEAKRRGYDIERLVPPSGTIRKSDQKLTKPSRK